MELTCLGLGKDQGKWCGPSCHLLQFEGAHLLLECPLDLSMLHLFLPAATISFDYREQDLLDDALEGRNRAHMNMGVLHDQSGKRQCLSFSDEDEDDEQTSWFQSDDIYHPCKSRISQGSHIHREERTSLSFNELPENTCISVVDGQSLLSVEPWYKTAEAGLLDVSSITVVIISNPEGMLGLPFLTRAENFSGKIYATNVTSKLGHLMMEELISLHEEYVQSFGMSERSEKPFWLSLTALNSYPAFLKKALVDDDGVGRANWQHLYGKIDIDRCMKQVQCLHYDEEVSIYDCLRIKPCSSGSELGASNWIISGARQLSYFSASGFVSGHCMALNVASHDRSEIFLFSDLRSNSIGEADDHSVKDDMQGTPCKSLHIESELMGEAFCAHAIEEISQLCKFMVEAVSLGGSVLMLISGIGAFLEALEVISQAFDDANLSDIPLFFISTMAEELLVYSNTIPEWLCNARQEKLFAGEALFRHVELLQQKRLHHLSTIYSSKTVKLWKEPCVAFVPDWGLRMGSSVALMHRWRQDPRCLLVLSKSAINAKLSLAPFQPLLMKVLQYNRGGKLGEAEVSAFVDKLKPKLSLIPETMKNTLQPLLHGNSNSSRHCTAYYGMWDVLTIPGPHHIEVGMTAEVASSIHPKQLDSGMAVGQVVVSVQQKKGKWLLDIPKLPEGKYAGLTAKEEICWGFVEVMDLVHILQNNGLCCEVISFEQDKPDHQHVREHCIDISSPSPAKVVLGPNCTVIETADVSIRKTITDAVKSFLTCV